MIKIAKTATYSLEDTLSNLPFLYKLIILLVGISGIIFAIVLLRVYIRSGYFTDLAKEIRVAEEKKYEKRKLLTIKEREKTLILVSYYMIFVGILGTAFFTLISFFPSFFLVFFTILMLSIGSGTLFIYIDTIKQNKKLESRYNKENLN